MELCHNAAQHPKSIPFLHNHGALLPATWPGRSQTIAPEPPPFGMDSPQLSLQICVMGQKIKVGDCPCCGSPMRVAQPPSGSGSPVPQCPKCDQPGFANSERAIGWLRSELQPPK